MTDTFFPWLLFTSLRHAGYQIRREQEEIVFNRGLSPDLLAMVTEHKADLIELVKDYEWEMEPVTEAPLWEEGQRTQLCVVVDVFGVRKAIPVESLNRLIEWNRKIKQGVNK